MLTLLAGCTHAAAQPPARGIHLPLDDYLPAPDEAAQASRAHRRLMAQCMRRFGMSLPEPPAVAGSSLAPNERRYGITNVEHARAAGYRIPRQPGEPTARAVPSPHPDLVAVMSGNGAAEIEGQKVPEGGCYGEARRLLHIHAPEAPDMFVAQRLDMESHKKSQEDDRVKAAFAEWSECMRTKGFDYPDPMKAAGDPAFRGPLTTAEVQTALADIACKQSTDLVNDWVAVETETQRVMIAAHREELEAIRRAQQGELTVARELGV